jgi:DNA-binding NarL/FixJ family response regulator
MRANPAASALIVDEQPLRLDGLEALLRRLGITVVARATSREEASTMVDERRPDILVTNYSLALEGNEGEEGVADLPLALLARARAVNTRVKCIVLSETDDPSERAHAFRSGATAYCIKCAAADDLAAVVRQAFAPTIYLAPADLPAEAPRTTANARRSPLTKREAEILRLAADGRSNSQLAKMLWVTEPTVKFHLSNVYRKLGVTNRTEASRWAHQNGLLAGDTDSSAAA